MNTLVEQVVWDVHIGSYKHETEKETEEIRVWII